MLWPRGPRLPDPCRTAVVLALALVLISPSPELRAASPDDSARPARPAQALPDSVCRALVGAFESLDDAALRGVLAPSEIHVAVMKGNRLPPPDDRKLSVDQAIVLLREALATDRRASVEDLAPGAIVAPAGTVACRCPEIGASGDDAFLVVHLGAAGREGRSRRLYLDLRRDGASWRIRAVREVL